MILVKKLKLSFSILAITCCILWLSNPCFAFGPTSNSPLVCFVIKNVSKNKIIFKKLVRPGNTFTYLYTHSLQKLPISETFLISKDLNIVLIESKVQSLSASGPFPAPDEEIHITKKFAYIQSKRKYKTLSLRIAYLFEQQIEISKQTITLNALAEPGDEIQITATELHTKVD